MPTDTRKLAEEIVDTAPERWYWLSRSEGIAIVEGMLARARKVIEAASAGAEERIGACALEIWHLYHDDGTFMPAAHAVASIIRRHFSAGAEERTWERRQVNVAELGVPVRYEITTENGWLIRFEGNEARDHVRAIDTACAIAGDRVAWPKAHPLVSRVAAPSESAPADPLCVKCQRPFHVHVRRLVSDEDGAQYEAVPACPTRGDLWTPAPADPQPEATMCVNCGREMDAPSCGAPAHTAAIQRWLANLRKPAAQPEAPSVPMEHVHDAACTYHDSQGVERCTFGPTARQVANGEADRGR